MKVQQQPASRDLTEATITDASFRLMVEAVIDYAVFMLDIKGNIATWNVGAKRIKGFAASEIIGKHFSIFYQKEDIEKGLPEEELSLATREGRFQDEGWRIRKDGSKLWASVTITALRDEEGTLLGFGKVTRDLTEQRLAAQDRLLTTRKRHQLLKSEAKATATQLRDIADSLADGIIEADNDWVIRFGNRVAAMMLPDFGVGRNLWRCFPAIVGTQVEDKLRQAMHERCYLTYENFYPPYAIWLRVRVSPSANGIAISFNDITLQKKLEEKLQLEATLREKRIEALTHMAAGLAHEISNPLAIIHATAGNLGLELEKDTSDKGKQNLIKTKSILQMSDRASRILKGLRGFAREAELDPMEYSSAYQIVSECVDMQETRFEGEGVDLKIDLPVDLPPFLCRETQIGQIITNLLNNSFDAITHACSVERWVKLQVREREGRIVFSVIDSGPGVADHFRSHIMEAFFTTKQKGLGMGIGLSLSRAIAEGHGGTLTLAAGPPTCMELTLPLEQ